MGSEEAEGVGGSGEMGCVFWPEPAGTVKLEPFGFSRGFHPPSLPELVPLGALSMALPFPGSKCC